MAAILSSNTSASILAWPGGVGSGGEWAVVLSQRGGDFELTVGEDFSIGYRSSDGTSSTSISRRACRSGSARRKLRCIWLTSERSGGCSRQRPSGFVGAVGRL